MIKYNFYCVICGTPFAANKKNARCCSNVCRFVLSKTMRYESIDEDKVVLETKEEKEEAEDKLKAAVVRDKSKDENRGVTREEIRKKRAIDFPDEMKAGDIRKTPSATGRLLGKREKPATPVEPELEPTPARSQRRSLLKKEKNQ